jgi:hypothetical protein
MLDTWPELPIWIQAFECSKEEVRDNVAAALRLNHRVSKVRLKDLPDPAWETFGPLMDHPFPTLTHFLVYGSFRPIKIPISPSFLGGSAPSLRDLHLDHATFPALPNLLLSATNLVSLWYDNISRAGYISPQAMVTGLSTLTRLESLSLTFLSSEPLPAGEIRILSPHAPTLLPTLTYLRFQGIPEYAEYLVAQIHGWLLEHMEIKFFHQEILEISELAKLIRRADKLSLVDRGEVTFTSRRISFNLSRRLTGIDQKTLMLHLINCDPDFRLSCLAQFCSSCLPTPSPFKCLYIDIPPEYVWQDFIEDPDVQWLELLRPFNTMKHLRLCQTVAPRVAQALRRLPLERVTEVLPALEIVFIKLVGPVMKAMSEFADARQLSGHPVSICDWEGREKPHSVGK